MKTEVKYIGTVPVKLFTGENPTKSVLAVHGFGGSKDSLAIEGLAQRLCDKGFRVAAPDLPCHGERTEKERELTPERCLSDILAVECWLRGLGGEVAAFGPSVGGFKANGALRKFVPEGGAEGPGGQHGGFADTVHAAVSAGIHA